MIHDKLLAVAAGASAGSGLYQGETFLPYAALTERADRLAAGFIELGIGRGSVVALLVPNSPEIFVVAHALFAIGAIAMPLALSATRTELAGLAAKTGLDAVIAIPPHAATAAALIADVAPAARLWLTTDLCNIERAPTRLPDLPGDTIGLYLFSSGSTGLPKVVPHTHAELIADANHCSASWGVEPGDIMLNVLPPNFAMGFLLGVTDVLAGGGSTLYWSDPLPLTLSRRKLLEAIGRHRPTIFGAVPAMYEILAGQSGDFDLSSLRLVFSGGAALKRSTFEAFRTRFGQQVRQAYGSTEVLFLSINNAPDPDATWATIGPPAGDIEVRIAPFATDLGPEVGELEIRSTATMRGYLDNPAANAEAFEGEWFRSGDLASLDGDGRITIRGRSKLLIEVSGYKIDPIEVEETLIGHPSIGESAVIGIPDARAGNRLVALVVQKDTVSADDVIRHARERLSVQKVPAEIVFVDSLPRSSSGKLLRGRLRELSGLPG